MPSHLVLSLPMVFALVFAPGKSVLSPEAAEHSKKAMRFYDAGQFASAADEFQAAYESMPDARRDLAGREQLLGSLRATLLAWHTESGEAAPLCRLQSILEAHASALASEYPEDPDRLEARSTHARQAEVTRQLAALGSDVCAPQLLPSTFAAPATAPEPRPEPAPTPTVDLPPRPAVTGSRSLRLQIAGGVTLPLGLVALGVFGTVTSGYRRDLAEADRLHEALAVRPETIEDRVQMRELLASARRGESLMLGLGVAGGALVTAGAVLLARGLMERRSTRLALSMQHRGVGFMISGVF